MKHFLENTFLLSIMLIGGIGIFFSFTSDTTTTKNNATANYSNDYQQSNYQNSDEDETSFLRVTGDSEVDRNMYFEIKSYNSNATYTLDLGNGVKKHFKSKKQRYAYKNAGRYNVKLFITYNGNTKLMDKQQMNIEHSVVASSENLNIN